MNALRDKIGAHVSSVSYSDIPLAAIDAVKHSLIDIFAVAWAGAGADTCPEIYSMLHSQGGKGEATVWVHGDKLPATSCAYLNSVFASALDFDTIHEHGVVHSDICVIPAALAIAEQQGCSGEDLLAAIAVGTDLTCRLGSSAVTSSGWFGTSVYGAIGAAAASARLLELDASQTGNALGLAFLQSSGSYQSVVERSLSKRHMSGFAARAGVFAALLAKAGVDGPTGMFDGKFGLYALYDVGNPGDLIADLGTEFEGPHQSFKLYPSCYCNHAAICGTLELVHKHDLKPEDINGIEVVISEYMNRLVGSQFDPFANPQVAAQFSLQYAVSCAVIRRKFTLEDLRTDAVQESAVGEFAQQVNIHVDPASNGTAVPAIVGIRLNNDEVLNCHVEAIPGMPHRPLTPVEFSEKIDSCFGFGPVSLSSNQQDGLTRKVMSLEKVRDMDQFFRTIELPRVLDGLSTN